MLPFVKRLIVLAGCFLVASCTPTIEGPGVGLLDRGISPLSTTDPYLGANLFLSREMERSVNLYSFLKSRGGPTAIDLSSTGRTLHLVLFYPQEKQVYAAELVQTSPARRDRPAMLEWIVRGPFQIERKDYRELAGMEVAMVGSPVFLWRGAQVRFNSQAAIPPERVLTPIVPPLPPPTPTPLPKVEPTGDEPGAPAKDAKPGNKEKPEILRKADEEDLIGDTFKPLNSDQQAIRMAKGFAERSENGDVLHTVKGDHEKITGIAKWYTGNIKNATEISEMNNLVEDQPLPKGLKVRVPAKLLVQSKSMPANFVE